MLLLPRACYWSFSTDNTSLMLSTNNPVLPVPRPGHMALAYSLCICLVDHVDTVRLPVNTTCSSSPSYMSTDGSLAWYLDQIKIFKPLSPRGSYCSKHRKYLCCKHFFQQSAVNQWLLYVPVVEQWYFYYTGGQSCLLERYIYWTSQNDRYNYDISQIGIMQLEKQE